MMKRNLARRLVQALIVLAGVTLLIFVMLRIVPGNPVETMMGEHANAETAHLLQKLEDYEGITILATNFANNIEIYFFTNYFSFLIQ